MREHELPSWQDMYRSALKDLDTARSALADAAGWLRSDWRPLGSPLPGQAGTARRDVLDQIGQLKGEIDQAKDALRNALDGHSDPSTEFADATARSGGHVPASKPAKPGSAQHPA